MFLNKELIIKRQKLFIFVLSSLFLLSCNSNPKSDTIIRWDTYGVPHIKTNKKFTGWVENPDASHI